MHVHIAKETLIILVKITSNIKLINSVIFGDPFDRPAIINIAYNYELEARRR